MLTFKELDPVVSSMEQSLWRVSVARVWRECLRHKCGLEVSETRLRRWRGLDVSDEQLSWRKRLSRRRGLGREREGRLWRESERT